MKHCIECGSELKEKHKFCSDCGSKIPKELPEILNHCPECGNRIQEKYKFCDNCGYKIPIKIDSITQEQKKEPIKEQQRNNLGFKPLFLFIIAIVIVITIVGLYMINEDYISNWHTADSFELSTGETHYIRQTNREKWTIAWTTISGNSLEAILYPSYQTNLVIDRFSGISGEKSYLLNFDGYIQINSYGIYQFTVKYYG